jgi:hypothetical protein
VRKQIAVTRRATTWFFVIVAFASLSVAYFGFDRPQWLPKSTSVFAWFALEVATLAIVTATFVFIAADASVKQPHRPMMDRADLAALIVLSTLAYAYAIYQIFKGDKGNVRLSYALFSSLLLFLWFRNTRLLFQFRIAMLARRIRNVTKSPETVFDFGRSMASEISRLSFSAILLVFPLLTWLPTLLPGRAFLAPQNLGFGFAIVTISIVVLTPLYIHTVLAQAITKSFATFDTEFAKDLRGTLNAPITKETAERLKANVELRNSVASSLNVSANDVITSLAQNLAIIAALIAIWYGKRP